MLKGLRNTPEDTIAFDSNPNPDARPALRFLKDSRCHPGAKGKPPRPGAACRRVRPDTARWLEPKEAGFTDRSISPRYLRTESAAQHEIYFFVRKGLL